MKRDEHLVIISLRFDAIDILKMKLEQLEKNR